MGRRTTAEVGTGKASNRPLSFMQPVTAIPAAAFGFRVLASHRLFQMRFSFDSRRPTTGDQYGRDSHEWNADDRQSGLPDKTQSLSENASLTDSPPVVVAIIKERHART
jgi:hypothetical protein